MASVVYLPIISQTDNTTNEFIDNNKSIHYNTKEQIQLTNSQNTIIKASASTVKRRVSNPKFYRKSGTYAGQVLVRLTSSTKDAVIYYTTNGKNPTRKSTKYKGAFTIRENTTIKAIALKKGMTKSNIRTAKYKISAAYAKRQGYLACNRNEKRVYKALYEGIEKFSNRIELPVNLNDTGLDRVYERVSIDNPHLLQFPRIVSVQYRTRNNVQTAAILINYRYSKKKYEKMLRTLDKKSDTIADAASFIKGRNGKIRYIHDAIIKGTIYGFRKNNAYNAYGVLAEGQGGCESYSRAFQLICQKLNIPAILVSGEGILGTVSGPHMWNMAKSGSKWYHIDLTWNSPSKKGATPSYDYYMVSTARISKDHIIYEIANNQTGMGYFNFIKIPNATTSMKKPK